MRILLSWSGPRSHAVAQALRVWLPRVIQATKPWMSSADIDRGARWQDEIGRQLEECSIGIICVTSDNTAAPWLLFEAGALSKIRASAHVCTYLHDGLLPTDITGPLALVQSAKANKAETFSLLRTINSKLAEPISMSDLEETFDLRWAALERELNCVPPPNSSGTPHRNDRELMEEMLTIVRDLARKSRVSKKAKPISPEEAVRNIRRHAKGAVELLGTPLPDPEVLVPGVMAYVMKHAPRSCRLVPQKQILEIISAVSKIS